MSDDLVKRAAALVEKQKAWDKWDNPRQPAPPAMVEGEVATLVSDMAAEITRLRAELATATQWRNAINDALASWHNQIDEEETPKEAIDRLIGYETAIERLNALDPSLSQDAADLVATARRDALAEIKQDTDELIEQGRQDGMEYAGEGKS